MNLVSKHLGLGLITRRSRAGCAPSTPEDKRPGFMSPGNPTSTSVNGWLERGEEDSKGGELGGPATEGRLGFDVSAGSTRRSADRAHQSRLHHTTLCQIRSRCRKPLRPAPNRPAAITPRSTRGRAVTDSGGDGTWVNGDRSSAHCGSWRICPS